MTDGWIKHDGGPCPFVAETTLADKIRALAIADAYDVDEGWNCSTETVRHLVRSGRLQGFRGSRRFREPKSTPSPT